MFGVRGLWGVCQGQECGCGGDFGVFFFYVVWLDGFSLSKLGLVWGFRSEDSGVWGYLGSVDF